MGRRTVRVRSEKLGRQPIIPVRAHTGKYFGLIVTVLACIFALATVGHATETPTNSLTRPHPDGVVGQLSTNAQFLYSSQYADTWNGGHDFQQYKFGLAAVAVPRLTLAAAFRLVDQSPRRYEATGGLRFYLSDPSAGLGRVNADGPIGEPVVTLAGGSSFFDRSDRVAASIFEAALDLPVSTRLTVGAGYRHYDLRPESEPLAAFARISVYARSYPADSAWANPDGPAGSPVFRFLGGGSSDGFLAQGELLVPLTLRQTLRAIGQITHAADPNRTTYSAGIGFAYYFQR